MLFPFLTFSQGSGTLLNFNGTNQIVSIPSLSTSIGNSDFTIECYAKFNSFVDYGGVITTFNSNLGGWAIHQQLDGTVSFYIGNNASMGGGETINSNPLSTGVWYHIVAVKNGNNIELFINGESQGSVVSNRMIPYNPINIGARYLNYSTWRHNGQLDEIRIWNAALTQEEIREWMCKKITNTHPEYSNLVAYYNFDSGLGSTLVDQTSNGNNGTLTNSPTWETSSLAIGNTIAFDVNVSTGSTLNLSNSDGSNLKVNITAGTANVIYIYNVEQEPNITTPPIGLNNLNGGNYFGVQSFGSNNLEYEVVYNYNGVSGISNESNLRLCSRLNNSSSTWVETAAVLNTTFNNLTLGGQTGTEFILGSTGGNTLLVEDFDLKEIAIYPNPTADILKLSTNKYLESFYKIYDVNGRMMLQGKLNSKQEISTKNLAKGMYFLKIDDVQLFKFLKQ